VKFTYGCLDCIYIGIFSTSLAKSPCDVIFGIVTRLAARASLDAATSDQVNTKWFL